jgi:hypothetical protein
MRIEIFIGKLSNAGLSCLKLFALISYLLFSYTAFADSSTIKISNNQISIRTNSTKVTYSETVNGLNGVNTAALDSERGVVPGYAILLSTMSAEDNIYFAAEYDKSSGQTIYTGAQQGGVFGSLVNTSTAVQTNYYFRLGKGFSSNADDSQTMATLYFEDGHHKWERGLGGTSPIMEVYSNDYLVFGALVQYSPMGSKLVLSGNAVWGVSYSSNIESSQSTVGTRGNPPTTQCGFSADYELINHIHANLSADMVSFSYNISSAYIVGAGKAPDTNINYTMIKLGLGYAF